MMSEIEMSLQRSAETDVLISALGALGGKLSRQKRLEMAVELSLNGVGDKMIQGVLGISRQTLWRWKKSEFYQRRIEERRGELFDHRLDYVACVLDDFLRLLRLRISEGDKDILQQMLRVAGPQLVLALLTRSPEHGGFGGSKVDPGLHAPREQATLAEVTMHANGPPPANVATQGNGEKRKAGTNVN